MTRDEAAARLNGTKYGEEGSPELFAEMKAAGLVAVFGASDDLMELRGALNDEADCYGGAVILITNKGLLKSECECGDCPYFERLSEKAPNIEAVWDNGGFSWTYDTAIPHAKFQVIEDDEGYCEGIVFALADVPAF